MATFATARFLSSSYGKYILYVPLKTARTMQSSIIAILFPEGVYRVYLNVDTGATPGGLMRTIFGLVDLLHPDGVFLDGYHAALESFGSELRQRCSVVGGVEYLVAVTSMMQPQLVFGPKSPAPLVLAP